MILSIFSCPFWPSICHLWRNVYLDLLPILWLRGSPFFFFNIHILSCMSFLYILEINPLLVASFENIFSHSVCCLSALVPLLCQNFFFFLPKLLSLIRSHLFIFVFTFITHQWIQKDLAAIRFRGCSAVFLQEFYSSQTYIYCIWASLVAGKKNLPIVQKTQVRSLGQEDPLEKEMATHSSILAWKTP